jgi:hypothetical protein
MRLSACRPQSVAMQRTQPGSDRHADPLTAGRALSRWGVAASVTGMACWVTSVALIPINAKLERGSHRLSDLLASHSTQLYAAALLAIVGAALLAGFFVMLTRLASFGERGADLLRVSSAACLITQTMVAVGAALGLAGVHAAVGGNAFAAAFGWRALWLAFLASAGPTILFTATGVLGLRQARLCPPWVASLGWISAAAHVLAMLTLAQRGVFAPDGIIALLTPLTTVIWIVALAIKLPGSWAATAQP